jgi:16S rRNA (guanine(966)-N(2))-methyltransferase RsmD
MKGRSLKTISRCKSNVRPILARVKKSLFDIISDLVEGSTFIDLFAGIGTVGIEALSCYAKHVTFVEFDDKLITYIKQNVENLNFETKSNVLKYDLLNHFQMLINNKFDIVFLDPPYNNDLTYITLRNILKYNIIKKTSLIISKRYVKEVVSNIQDLICIKMLKYGDTVIAFYKIK